MSSPNRTLLIRGSRRLSDLYLHQKQRDGGRIEQLVGWWTSDPTVRSFPTVLFVRSPPPSLRSLFRHGCGGAAARGDGVSGTERRGTKVSTPLPGNVNKTMALVFQRDCAFSQHSEENKTCFSVPVLNYFPVNLSKIVIWVFFPRYFQLLQHQHTTVYSCCRHEGFCTQSWESKAISIGEGGESICSCLPFKGLHRNFNLTFDLEPRRLERQAGRTGRRQDLRFWAKDDRSLSTLICGTATEGGGPW